MSKEIVKSITALASTTERGQKVTAVLIEYDCELRAGNLVNQAFEVADRTVLDTYVTVRSDFRQPAEQGNCIMLCLDPKDPAAIVYKVEGHKGPPPKPEDMPKLPPPKITNLGVKATVRQCVDLKAADGTLLSKWDDWEKSTAARELVVEEYQHGVFRDTENGNAMMYSLYIPKCAEDQRLPLVVFIGDGNTCSDAWNWSLVSVNGGTVWAEPEEQAKHPCYVLVPQISKAHGSPVNDQYEANEDCDTIERLIHFIMDTYSIDEERVFSTGQSMGCMTFCEINCREPELFASSLFVAGQWDPHRMAEQCAHKNVWIVVSEGDEKAFPGMNAVTDAMQEAGANLIKGYWNAKMSQEEFRKEVERMGAEKGVHYSVLDKATVLNEGDLPKRDHHLNTWKIVYNIEALRDWLLSQKR